MKSSQAVLSAMTEVIRQSEGFAKAAPDRILSINTSLLVASQRWCANKTETVIILLNALNELPPSFMREEYILLLEGQLALREIRPMMDDSDFLPRFNKPKLEIRDCKKDYGKSKHCKCCLHLNDLARYTCDNCGEILG